jgi:chromosome partitioning protein
MKVVTFSIFKGGTAKTTSTVNTAAALAMKGKKVLVVDLDQQASATRYLDLDPDASPNLYEVFSGSRQATLAIRKTKLGIDVLSSHVLMAAIEEALEPGDETKLSDLIMPLRGLYDFILIDTPPGKAMLAFNGLAAADLILIPASAERMAVDGVADLINHVQRIMWTKFNLNHQELPSGTADSLYHVPLHNNPLTSDRGECPEDLAGEYFIHANPPLNDFLPVLR